MKCQKINFSLACNYSTITNIYRFSIFYFAFFSMLDHDVKLVFSVLWLWLKAVESALGQINPYSSTDYRRHAVSHRLLFPPLPSESVSQDAPESQTQSTLQNRNSNASSSVNFSSQHGWEKSQSFFFFFF